MKNTDTRSKLQKAARTSWRIPIATSLLLVFFNTISKDTTPPIAWVIIGSLVVLLLVVGFILGCVGCFGMKKHSAKSTLVPGMIGLVLNGLILFLILSVAIPVFNKARANSEVTHSGQRAATLKAMADETNKTLPILIDQDFRLDEVIPNGGDQLVYKYTVLNFSIADINIEEFAEGMKTELKSHIDQNDSKMAWFRENHVEVNHTYYDNTGQYLTNLVFKIK